MRLRQLHRWLTLEGSSFALGSFALFLPYGLVFTLLKWGAVLFTPYMIWRLFQSKRYAWIVGFAIVVGIPALWVFFRRDTGISDVSGFLLYLLPLITFYAYTWLLRYSVGEWLEELRWKRQDRHRETYG